MYVCIYVSRGVCVCVYVHFLSDGHLIFFSALVVFK